MAFINSEAGAVTVDWVVLTAGLVGLGLATMAVVSAGVQDVSGDIDAQLASDHIISTTFRYGPFIYSGRGTSGDYQSTLDNAGNISDADVIGELAPLLAAFEFQVNDEPVLDTAGDSLDTYVAYYEIAEARGLEIPNGMPHPEILNAQFMEAYDTAVANGSLTPYL